MIYAFPTFHGGVGEALGAYGRGVGTVLDPDYDALPVLDTIARPVNLLGSCALDVDELHGRCRRRRIGGSPEVGESEQPDHRCHHDQSNHGQSDPPTLTSPHEVGKFGIPGFV